MSVGAAFITNLKNKKKMNAKEKAEELILKFMRLQEPNYNWFHSKLAKRVLAEVRSI